MCTPSSCFFLEVRYKQICSSGSGETHGSTVHDRQTLHLRYLGDFLLQDSCHGFFTFKAFIVVRFQVYLFQEDGQVSINLGSRTADRVVLLAIAGDVGRGTRTGPRANIAYHMAVRLRVLSALLRLLLLVMMIAWLLWEI